MSSIRPALAVAAAVALYMSISGCTVGEPDEVASEESAVTSPAPGSSCATTNQIASRACGLCGQQKAICLSNGRWSEYSPCAGEPVDACTPGTIETGDACGNCGTRTRTCSTQCRWTPSTCGGQGPCAPDSVEFTNAGCGTGYRRRDCNATCGLGSYSACETQKALVVNGAGAADSTVVYLDPSKKTARLGGDCPRATSDDQPTPFTYVRVDNASSSPVTVSIRTRSKTGKRLDVVVAAYTGTSVPSTPGERAACLRGVADDAAPGSPALSDAALTGSDAVRIEANGSVLVYVGGYYTSDSGALEVEARVDAVL